MIDKRHSKGKARGKARGIARVIRGGRESEYERKDGSKKIKTAREVDVTATF